MDINPKQFMEAIEQIAEERKIPKERILETVEAAIAAAYRKDFGHPEQHVRAKLNPETGETELYLVYDIVAKKDDVENEHTQITVAEAKKKGAKTPKTGEEYVEKVKPPEGFGRIAAQTAKQVIIQRIREVEREIVRDEFSDRTGELMTGSVQRIEGRNVFVEVGRAIGVMGPDDQIQSERYYIGQRLRVMLKEVDPEGRGAQLILTRSHPDFVRRLFELEVPEIHAGTVEIKSVAREAGVRSKVAVASNQEGVDPVGTCVGQRGTRVQAIMAELGEEKIDIVLFDEDDVTYITNALSPAKISKITLDKKTDTASINVADDQLSLAIGRGGQNVRLAGELTGWQLDIEKSDSQKKAEAEAATSDDESGVVASIPMAKVEGVTEDEAKAFDAAKIGTAQHAAAASDEELAKVEGVEDERKKEILQAAAQAVSESIEPEPTQAAEEPKKEEASEEPKEEPAEAEEPEKEAEVTEEPAEEKAKKPAEEPKEEAKPAKTTEGPAKTDEKPDEAKDVPEEKPEEPAKEAGDDSKDESSDSDDPGDSK
ncbi:transcription termination/antitermination protein NusA [Patescibacteria group bacterium]|nr:transcription termination/antitermination protein NusA [Patescibacteria group bacterium]